MRPTPAATAPPYDRFDPRTTNPVRRLHAVLQREFGGTGPDWSRDCGRRRAAVTVTDRDHYRIDAVAAGTTLAGAGGGGAGECAGRRVECRS